MDTIIPLSPTQLKDFILSKDAGKINRTVDYIVDYEESQLKLEYFLNYIANMRLCISIKNLSTTDASIILSKYMTSNISIAINDFAIAMGKVLMYRTGDKDAAHDFIAGNIDSFIDNNLSNIIAWEKFLTAVPYTAPFFFTFYKEVVGDALILNKEIEVIDDPKAVSPNVLNMLLLDGFLENYLSRISSFTPAYYRYFMTQRCFEGKNMINILADHGTIIPFIHNLSLGGESILV